jgi:hypothetical protein
VYQRLVSGMLVDVLAWYARRSLYQVEAERRKMEVV